MGSFNTTCFLTGQTIAPGDRAYIFPIQQSIGYDEVKFAENGIGIKSAFKPYHSTCYSNAFWQPMGGVISCAYDDYGRFNIDKTKINEGNIAKFLKTNFLKTLAGENQFHDLSFDPASIDINDPIAALDSAWDVMVHSGRVFTYRSYNRSPAKVGFAVVCAPAFDLAVKRYGKYNDWNGNRLDVDSQINRINAALSSAWDASSGVKKQVETLLSNQEFKSSVDSEIGEVSEEEMHEAIAEIASYRATDSIREMFGSGEGYRFSHHIEVNHIVKSGRPDGERAKNIESFIRSCIEEKNFFCYLEVLNAKVQPIVYTSQDYENEIGREYAKLVAETQKIVTANRKSKYED